MSDVKTDWLTWLHALTDLAYDSGYMLATVHGGIIREYFDAGYSPDEALVAYLKFLRNY